MSNAKQFKAWSYSRWKSWKECAHKAFMTAIVGLKDPRGKGDALIRGQKIHEEAAAYLSGRGRNVPKSCKELAPEFRGLRKLKPQVEGQWAFNDSWVETGWFDKDCWTRVVVDAFAFTNKDKTGAVIVDHKTGKVREAENTEQIELYALAAFARYPKLETVAVELWYLDYGVILPMASTLYKRSEDFERLMNEWNERAEPMMRAKRFPKNPGNYCRWCFLSKSNGGRCEY